MTVWEAGRPGQGMEASSGLRHWVSSVLAFGSWGVNRGLMYAQSPAGPRLCVLGSALTGPGGKASEMDPRFPIHSPAPR